MTREEILTKWDSMTPRERDAWVAEDVMGWKERVDFDYVDGIIARYIPGTMDVVNFQPSTDISAAWEVVEKFGSWQVTKKGVGNLNKEYRAIIDKNKNVAFANNAPEAICKAALIAVMEGQSHGSS